MFESKFLLLKFRGYHGKLYVNFPVLAHRVTSLPTLATRSIFPTSCIFRGHIEKHFWSHYVPAETRQLQNSLLYAGMETKFT